MSVMPPIHPARLKTVGNDEYGERWQDGVLAAHLARAGKVPAATVGALQRRGKQARIFVLGPAIAVPAKVAGLFDMYREKNDLAESWLWLVRAPRIWNS